MIKHIVMWKLKEFAEGNGKAENAGIIKKRSPAQQGFSCVFYSKTASFPMRIKNIS